MTQVTKPLLTRPPFTVGQSLMVDGNKPARVRRVDGRSITIEWTDTRSGRQAFTVIAADKLAARTR